MKGKIPARNLGGRPAEREPELGKRTQLNIALALPLKQRIEREAVNAGWSMSSEAAYRLQRAYAVEELLADFARLMVETTLDGMGGQKPRKVVMANFEHRIAQLISGKGGDKK
ncbi:hypothetical protein [Methyloceanibacter sp.]|uniref:hypothetical protein n=1 Tax=Methyloceanibacter sp. TaxID=1965321 RepID=UPI00351B7677